MERAWAIVERELRRFRRSPTLIVVSLVFPVVQLVVLGYAFGGNVKHLRVAVVDQDHGVPAVRIRELASAVASGNHTFDLIDYADPGVALTDLLADGLSMVYSFFEPDEDSRSLGTFMILDHIARARRMGLPYVYLGYWIDGSRKMHYKSRYLPQQRLAPSGWLRIDAADTGSEPQD